MPMAFTKSTKVSISPKTIAIMALLSQFLKFASKVPTKPKSIKYIFPSLINKFPGWGSP